MKNGYVYLLLWVLLAGLCLSSVGMAFAAVPELWQWHEDPLGFRVRYPPNWTAEVIEDELIWVHNAAGTAFVLVQPFFARDGVTAQAWIGEVPVKLGTILPNAVLADSRQVSYQPDEVTAELSFDNRGEPGRALALCVLDGRSGMFYAVAAPARTFSELRSVLLDILGTFSFITPTAPVSVEGGGVSYVKWVEPSETAFSLEVPQGWQVTGGLYRETALDVRPDVQIASPDGQMFFRIGDKNIPPFTVPTQILEMTGFPEGSWYSYMGQTWMVRRYVGGLDFARDYAMQNLPDGCMNANITGERDRFDLSGPINDIYARYNLYGASMTISMGEVGVKCQVGGHTWSIYSFAGTKLTQVGDGGIWSVDYLIYGIAPTSQDAAAAAILGHIANSYEPNYDWMRRQAEVAGSVGDIVARAGEEMREIMRKTFETESQVRDDAARRWGNMILGMTDVRDPETGEEWRVASGHNYYWRKGDTIVGTDIDRPNVDFTPLTEF